MKKKRVRISGQRLVSAPSLITIITFRTQVCTNPNNRKAIYTSHLRTVKITAISK